MPKGIYSITYKIKAIISVFLVFMYNCRYTVLNIFCMNSFVLFDIVFKLPEAVLYLPTLLYTTLSIPLTLHHLVRVVLLQQT